MYSVSTLLAKMRIEFVKIVYRVYNNIICTATSLHFKTSYSGESHFDKKKMTMLQLMDNRKPTKSGYIITHTYVCDVCVVYICIESQVVFLLHGKFTHVTLYLLAILIKYAERMCRTQEENLRYNV